MKRILFAVFLSVLIFCGCSENKKSAEADRSETGSSAVGSENGAESETEISEYTKTTEASSKTETAPLSKIEPASQTNTEDDDITIKPTSHLMDTSFDVMGCTFSDVPRIENEKDFSDKDVIVFARKICFADEYVQSEIKLHNSIDSDYIKKVGAAEDIEFIAGWSYDFDLDYDKEYVIYLNYRPFGVMSGGFLIYIDGNDYKILGNGIDSVSADVSVIDAGGYRFLETYVAGGTHAFQDIYSLETGMPKMIFDISDGRGYEYKNGVFYLSVKYDDMIYPFVLCTDGIFRQLACEKITREDFEAHVTGGKEYLDFIAEKGDEVTEIYTYGYSSYRLFGDHKYPQHGAYFEYAIFENDTGEFTKIRYRRDESNEGYDYNGGFMDEVLYGLNVHRANPISSRVYHIDDGYCVYISRRVNNTSINAAKNGILIDSLDLGDEDISLDTKMQIKFYDIDTPPCFALNVNYLYYYTYFIIDDRIKKVYWELDGEPLEKVFYTMLTCYGDGDGFVTYTAPSHDHLDSAAKRHFYFDNGHYNVIRGYTEPVPKPEGYAAIVEEVFERHLKFIGGAYNSSSWSEPHENTWAFKADKEGYRTKSEIMDSLRKYCTESAAEKFYAFYIEETGDFIEEDGYIYVYDGPPGLRESIRYIGSTTENNGVITAKIHSYKTGQDLPYKFDPPLYADFVMEDGVWKFASYFYTK